MESNRHSIETVIKHTRKRHRHRHRRTKDINQKIELKKQQFQCVINLNTTICEHEAHRSELNTKICEYVSDQGDSVSHPVSSLVREPFTLKSQCYSRMAPYCSREKCQGMVKPCRCQEIRKRRDRVRDTMAKHRHHISRKHRQDGKQIRRLPDRHRKPKNDSHQLSTMSSAFHKDDLNHLYEDISNDSLDEVLETPMSYKNVRYVENKVESKLDTLIKRAKERERKQVAQSRCRPSHSMSCSSNISSGECPMDLGTLDSVSLHSQSTLVLENSQSSFVYLSSDNENYSQEYSAVSPNDFTKDFSRKYEYGQLFSSGKRDLNMNFQKKYDNNEIYLPKSPLQSDCIVKKYDLDFKIGNIKSEPIDNRTYSLNYSKEIKKEIKIETESVKNDTEMLINIKKEF